MDNQYQRRGAPVRRRRKKRKRRKFNFILILCLLLIIAGAVILVVSRAMGGDSILAVFGKMREPKDYTTIRPEMQVSLLTPNEYSRPQKAVDKITGIVIHYTANPGTTAMNNRDYFESLKDTQDNYVSSHFVVGIDGEIVQCIPTTEVAYASNERNHDTISIEVCHMDESGVFSSATYDSLVSLTGWLCLYLDVPPENVIRHYDVTGKICPKYYVEHEDAWEFFKQDVEKWYDKNK